MSAATVVTVVLDEHQTRVQEMANEPLEIEVLVSKRPLQKAGVRMATGFITASQLHARYKVPNLDPVTRQGYQRPPQMPRVARLVARLKDGSVDLPTALLLNLRKDQVAGRIVEREGKTFLVLRPGDALYVVDGQHRVIAVVDRLFLEDLAKWFDFEIPFVAMLGADEAMEMTEFYVVNSTAKQVPTDLAYELLQRRAEADAGLMEQLDGSGQAWIVRAQSLVTFLNDAGVWKDRIRLAATSKGDTTINNAGMVNSLKPLLQMAYFGTTITEDNQVKILDAFWRGLQRVLPECFEEPAEYSLQKSVGVQAMHHVLVYVLEYLRSEGQFVTDPENYEAALRDALRDLEGANRSGDPVTGPDFWRVGAEGAAGSYTSNAGRRVLVAKIRSRLPKASVR
ncbi:MAG TPA: DGQHR domain-containing protein [Candidatus Dormibacteraeota bacterium]|nr:DGQHR domain-containing protein [Candidatus Dormibacteraeota bacterium]